MPQEHAKKFLHSNNDEERYKFFLQAANLATRKQDLSSTKQNNEHLREKLNRAEASVLENEEKARKAKHEYEGAKQLKEIQNQLNELETMLGWGLVSEKEQELTNAEQAAEKAAAKEEEMRGTTVQVCGPTMPWTQPSGRCRLHYDRCSNSTASLTDTPCRRTMSGRSSKMSLQMLMRSSEKQARSVTPFRRKLKSM